LTHNQWEFGLATVLANVWAFEKDRFLLDYESLHSTFHVNYGLTDEWTLELAYEERRIFGGILDGFISDFHDTSTSIRTTGTAMKTAVSSWTSGTTGGESVSIDTATAGPTPRESS
jgi:hypothetical protein